MLSLDQYCSILVLRDFNTVILVLRFSSILHTLVLVCKIGRGIFKSGRIGSIGPFEIYLPVTWKWNAPSSDRTYLGYPSTRVHTTITRKMGMRNCASLYESPMTAMFQTLISDWPRYSIDCRYYGWGLYALAGHLATDILNSRRAKLVK
jgi:hypothetical protein